MKHAVVSLCPLESGYSSTEESLLEFLDDGYEIINVTASDNNFIYILRK